MLPISYFREKQGELEKLIRIFVEYESPTLQKSAVDALGTEVAERMEALGASVRRYPQEKVGDHWLGQWGKGPGGVLLIVHFDTVFPLGTLETMPWREDDQNVYGPGVADMKASIAMALVAIASVIEKGGDVKQRVSLFANSDEERGSETSRSVIEELAQQHDVTFVLEMPLPSGAVKTQRKGVGSFILETFGRAAHAGADPEKGINAVIEMSHQVQRAAAFADAMKGTTVSIDLIEGGTTRNTIPAYCRAGIDVRIIDPAEQKRIEAAFAELSPVLPEARVAWKGAWGRPVMQRTQEIAQTYETAKSLSAELGIELQEGSGGGGSDANFVAALGLPVLDGLGPVGKYSHSEREHIVRDRLAERTALLAALISQWPRSH